MSTRRMWTIGFIVVVMLVITARMSGNATGHPAAQFADNVTIPYSGQLTTDTGEALADGTYAMQFSLYSDTANGELLWTETQTNVQISLGSFAVVLGNQTSIPIQALNSGNTWLEVSVRGPDEHDFTALSPRQVLVNQSAPTRSTASSCAHTHFGDWWTGSSPDPGFVVENTSNGTGIQGSTISPINPGVFGINVFGPGVQGYSDGGTGVVGYSSTTRGVYGFGVDGVVGESASNDMSGVYGSSTAASGYGITGHSDNSFGVVAAGDDEGYVDAVGDVLLDGNWGEIFAEGIAMDLFSNGDFYVDLDQDNNTPMSGFVIYSGDDVKLWSVYEPSGNIVAAGSQASVVQTASQGKRLMYAIEGTGVWLEDVGTAMLVNGEKFIPFDPVYAQAASLTQQYQIFVTATCNEAVVMYVSSKSPTGFTVSGVNLDGSSSSCSFDYRVVAPRQGYESVRLEEYTSEDKVQP